MDTFVDSSWYFLRFLSPKLETKAFDTDAVNRWLPVNQYIGGVEHAILHLLYARFMVKVFRDMGLVSFREPFERLFAQGMITKNGYKMSKSKGNVVPPDALIERYGADTVRVYTLFIGPPEKDAEWNDRGVEGGYRFLARYWKLIEDFAEANELVAAGARRGGAAGASGKAGKAPRAATAATPAWAASGPARDLRRRVHQLVAQICDDVERFHFNTAVSGLMQLVNSVQDYQAERGDLRAPEVVEAVDLGSRLLAPMAPHTAEGAWDRLGHQESIVLAPWPAPDATALHKVVERLVVQVNGKVRAQIDVPAGSAQKAVETAALADERVRRFTQGRTPAQVIFVPGRLLNIVLKA
jgi:leucyl-tRNA synthetase